MTEASQASSGGTFQTRDGVTLRYRHEGRGGQCLVFVHGWCSREADWAPQAVRFSGRHRVLRYDRRGHGASDAPLAGYSPDAHARDLAQLLDHLDLRNVILIAHAGGAPTALALAAKRPGLVRAVALVEANLYTAEDQLRRTGPLMEALRQAGSIDVFRQAYRCFLHSRCDESLVARVVGDAAATPVRVIVAELEGLVVDTFQLARAVTQPVLWIASVLRPGCTDSKGVAEAFPDVRYGQVVGAAHFPQLEVPDQVNAMLAHFVEAELAPPAMTG